MAMSLKLVPRSSSYDTFDEVIWAPLRIIPFLTMKYWFILDKPSFSWKLEVISFPKLQSDRKNIENFWSKIDFKNVDFENFRKSWFFDFFDFSIFRKKTKEIQLFSDFSIFSKNSDFPIFRKFFMKILIFRKFSKSTFLKSIFDQKISIFFHDLF